jgi:hypothetical protein
MNSVVTRRTRWKSRSGSIGRIGTRISAPPGRSGAGSSNGCTGSPKKVTELDGKAASPFWVAPLTAIRARRPAPRRARTVEQRRAAADRLQKVRSSRGHTARNSRRTSRPSWRGRRPLARRSRMGLQSSAVYLIDAIPFLAGQALVRRMLRDVGFASTAGSCGIMPQSSTRGENRGMNSAS